MAILTRLASGKYQTRGLIAQRVRMKERPNRPSDTKMKYHDLLQGSVNHLRQRHAGRALGERAVVLSPEPPTESLLFPVSFNSAQICFSCNVFRCMCPL